MKIILFTPWFGQLPNYFITWLASIRHLENVVDFVFITDCHDVEEFPRSRNFIVKYMSWAQLQNKFQSVFGVKISHAYKLCDYKPVYNHLFSEFISDKYEYWGYCDIDTIFGDVEKFLNEIEYYKYDRVGHLGHFTIYKQDNSIKDIYKTIIPGDHDPYHKFSYLSRTTYPCHFDEEGANIICKHLGINFYQLPLFFNTCEKSYHIHVFDHLHDNELLTWEKGHTFRYYQLQNGNIIKEERMYIHYGVQKNMPQVGDLGDSFCLTPNGFRHFDPVDLESFLIEYGRPDNKKEKVMISKQFKSYLRNNRKIKLLREYHFFGILGVMRSVFFRSRRLIDVIFKYKNL